MKNTILLLLLLLFSSICQAADDEPIQKMDNDKLAKLVKRLDKKAVTKRSGFWILTLEKRQVLIITDEKADRMRIMCQVAKADKLSKKLMHRLLQSNFDSALDSRYAIANNVLWSAFIHPLSPLKEKEFFSGVAQVVTLAETYGSSFSSGALIFRGGDSSNINRKLYEKILRKGAI